MESICRFWCSRKLLSNGGLLTDESAGVVANTKELVNNAGMSFGKQQLCENGRTPKEQKKALGKAFYMYLCAVGRSSPELYLVLAE